MFEKIIQAVGALGKSIFESLVQKKIDSKNQIQYDTYQKQMAIYEEIVVAMSSMTAIEKLPMDISARDLSHKIFEYTHDLKTFINRLSLLGSGGVINVLYSIIAGIQREPEDRPENVTVAAYNASLRAVFCNTMRNSLISFTQAVREEGIAGGLDKKIAKRNEKAAQQALKKRKKNGAE